MDTNDTSQPATTTTEPTDSNEQQKESEETIQTDNKSTNVNKDDEINEDKNTGDSLAGLATNPSLTSTLATTTTTTTTTSLTTTNSNRVEIMLKPVGSAPILKKKKFILERTKNIKWLVEWLKKYMKLDIKEQLFVYVNQEFAPSLDTEIGTIFDCFGISNTIIFHYCTTPAWG